MINKFKEKNIFNRVLIILFASLFSLFTLFNLAWYAYREIRYNPLIEKIPESYGIRITSIDNYSYSVTKPSYLSFGGNLSLVNEETKEDLIIWPLFPSGYDYAVTLEISEQDNSYSSFHMLIVDENGDFIKSCGGEKNAERVHSENVDVIQNMLLLANEMWKLKE